MTNEEKINYLSNIILAIHSDGKTYKSEEQFMNKIAKDIQAGYYHIDNAVKLVESGNFTLTLPERYSDGIRLLEDVLLILNIDKQFDDIEKDFIKKLAGKLYLSQKGIDNIQEYCRNRINEME